MKFKAPVVVLTIALFFPCTFFGQDAHIAVSGNFAGAIKEIVKKFHEKNHRGIILSFGSTGRHYAQIKNGAPFDAFFAADVERPKLLEEEGIAKTGSRFTYAVGKVVLWSPRPDRVDKRGEILFAGNFRHLAVANPKLAPYGKAAEEIMKSLGLWSALQGKIVRGENISQAFQFVQSGNAELGFVAFSQITNPKRSIGGSLWEPPQNLYNPVKQQAVLLTENPTAGDFAKFVRSKKAGDIIKEFGYRLP